MANPRREVIIRDYDPTTPGVQGRAETASKGMHGDTLLAHVNPWEEALLKRLGGVGTRNPMTGLKQFYQDSEIADWYRNSLGREPDPEGLAYWQNYNTPEMSGNQLWNAFKAAGASEPALTTWTPPPSPVEIPYAPINFPTNVMPKSESNNQAAGINTSNQGSQNLGLTGGQNQSSNTSTNASEQFSGLNSTYRDMIMNAIMPQLAKATSNMESNIDKYTGNALGSYNQTMQNALRTNIPKIVSSLATRGIISSTDAQKILGEATSAAAIDASQKGYQTAMQAALLKAQMPQILAQLSELGKYSTGVSTGSSAGNSTGSNYGLNLGSSFGESLGLNTSTGSSYSSDPTVMYRAIADLLRSQF